MKMGNIIQFLLELLSKSFENKNWDAVVGIMNNYNSDELGTR